MNARSEGNPAMSNRVLGALVAAACGGLGYFGCAYVAMNAMIRAEPFMAAGHDTSARVFLSIIAVLGVIGGAIAGSLAQPTRSALVGGLIGVAFVVVAITFGGSAGSFSHFKGETPGQAQTKDIWLMLFAATAVTAAVAGGIGGMAAELSATKEKLRKLEAKVN